MNLFKKLKQRAAVDNPVRVGMIGAGKFGSMFLSQAIGLPGVHVVGIVDLNPEGAKANLDLTGWSAAQYSAPTLAEAAATGATHVGDNWEALVACPQIDIIIECTGNPVASVRHCLGAFANGKHVINVSIEADAVCGYGLARRAEAAGVIYSMAYGDQPALVCDLVDWARTCGFNVVAAGRGHKWLPNFAQSTPDTVWENWGLTPEQAARGRLNPKMFNAFVDGTKPAIESAAIANACGLDAPDEGLVYPPGSADDIPNLMRPKSEGGHLDRKGLVEVVSCLTPDGREIPHHVRQGVWVCLEGETEYKRNCFEEYNVVTDTTGRYAAMYKRFHLIGLELAVSVASVGLRGEPTGVSEAFRADVSAIAKRDLAKGEILDGEGGYTVTGGLRPATVSVAQGYLPLGLAHDARLLRPIKAGQPVTWADVEIDQTTEAYALRRETEGLIA